MLRVAWRHAGRLRGRLLSLYLLFALSTLISAAQPAVYGWFIDRIQRDPEQVLRTTWVYGGIYLAITLLAWAIHGPCRVAEQKLAFDVSLHYLQRRYHETLHLPLRWHQDHHSGATINRIRKGYEALRGFLSNGFEYAFLPFKLAISLAAMIYFSPLFGFIGLAMTVLTFVVIVRFDRPLVVAQDAVNEREHSLAATMFDSLSNIVTVITLRLERSMERGLLAKAMAILPPFRYWSTLNEWKWWTAENIVALTYAIIVVGYVRQHWQTGQMFPVGGLVALVGYVNQYAGNFQSMTWQYSAMVHFHTDVEGASGIESQYAAHHRPDAPPALPAGWRGCDIRHIDYAHRPSEEFGLQGVNLELARGRKIAIVGESGSGKSTLLAVLRGLHDAAPGLSASVDGRACEMGSGNETTTLFPQEPEIFENTIEYNVTLGLPVAEAEIRRVCDVAHFSSVIDELPRGLASSILEKGVNLSGGQKQRLALARGILAARDCDIVLLDEPTSSVDPKTELQIYEKMFSEFADKAVVSALHRMHLLRLFDVIYVLQRGRVVASGSLEELLQSSGHFQELWRHQDDAFSPRATT